MPTNKYSVEQIVAKLREAERLQGQGLTMPQLCKRLGISDQTFYPWRLKYGALGRTRPAAKGLGARERPPEEDRRRPRRRHRDAEVPRAGKMVSPTRRRHAVAFLRRRHPVSERRACRLVGLHRSTQRYCKMPPDYELAS